MLRLGVDGGLSNDQHGLVQPKNGMHPSEDAANVKKGRMQSAASDMDVDMDLKTETMWRNSQSCTNSNSSLRERVNMSFGLTLQTYNELYQWSIDHIDRFWAMVWEFCGVIYSQPYTYVLQSGVPMNHIPKWFIGARLNYAENALRFKDERTALISANEYGLVRSLSFAELHEQVRQCSNSLKAIGVKKGDCVAAYISNSTEAVISMLAVASIGAIWTSCAPDLGPSGVLDRFKQVNPKVLISVNGVIYNGKIYSHLEKLRAVVHGLPTLEKVLVISSIQDNNLQNFDSIPLSHEFEDFLSKSSADHLVFEQLPFNAPLFIVYSSGTTGKPKCIVHSAGGALIQHMKEHIIHGGMTRDDIFFYYTTTSWMMWQWLVGGLFTGATLVLYDGSPFKPHPHRLWNLVDELGITIFGTSAKYLQSLQEFGVSPKSSHNLSTLRQIYSTGSPLYHEQFDFVYDHIKSDVLLGSITGGTDILSLFAGHTCDKDVVRGEIMARCLGMAVESWDHNGNPVVGIAGDLVCTKPFPIMPVFFWDDESGEKYQAAYFNKFPGVWYHGDYMILNPVTGGVIMLGRSDGTLKPGGVRFGSSELYNIMSSFKEVSDCLAVGQKYNNDERVIMFCKMSEDSVFTPELEKEIRKCIREQLSPRHVPSIILPIADIPYTLTGKKVEIAVKKIVNGEINVSRDTLANPRSLDLYLQFATVFVSQ